MNQAQKKELPPRYYLDNFNSLLSFVERMYAPLLSAEEQAFIARFRELSEDARCLFLRFANRRGLFFRTDRLVYPEIADIPSALDELLFRKFIELPSARHKSLAPRYLAVFSRADLCTLYKVLDPEVKGLSKLKKPELISFLQQTFSWDQLLEASALLAPLIKHNYEQELELLKFLFFGHLWGDMSEFVIRNLGMVRYESPEEDKLVAMFRTRKELEDKFAVSVAYDHFRELREENCAESLYGWYMDWSSRYSGWCEQAEPIQAEPIQAEPIQAEPIQAEPLFNRLTIKLARILERQQQAHWALEVYERTQLPPARERRVRLLFKTGAVQEAIELCHQMEQAPQNADELFFARDFAAKLRKKRKTKSTTLHLKEAGSIQISGEYRYQVEKGVMHYYAQRGHEVMYSENYLWRSLFGLVFWDIIYDQEAPVFHSPLQRAPSDLYLPHFLYQRKDQLEARMQELDSSKRLIGYIEQVYNEKWGMGNPLVNWHENTLPLLRAVGSLVKPDQLKRVLLEMARNMKENGRGFPDLFCWNGSDYSFIEVKSPNDTLSAQQLFWLQFFQECGISAKVLKVEWQDMKVES